MKVFLNVFFNNGLRSKLGHLDVLFFVFLQEINHIKENPIITTV